MAKEFFLSLVALMGTRVQLSGLGFGAKRSTTP